MKHDNLSSDDGSTQCDTLAPSDIEPTSLGGTQVLKKATTKKVKKEKKNKAKPTSSRRENLKMDSTPIFHITWDGFVTPECEKLRHVCQLCEEDLMATPVEGIDYKHFEQINEPQIISEVAILACCHTFHTLCLDQATSEEQCRDPICIICLSCES